MGYKGLWVIREIGYEGVDCSISGELDSAIRLIDHLESLVYIMISGPEYGEWS